MFRLKEKVIQKLVRKPSPIFIKRRVFRFQQLTKNYGKILELLSDLIEKQGGEFIFDKQYFIAHNTKLWDLTEIIIYDLNVLSERQHLEFYEQLDQFKRETKELISGRPVFSQGEMVIPFSAAANKKFLILHLGSENAALLAIHQRLGVLIPEGFAITYSAYQQIIESNRLSEVIQSAVDKFQKNDPLATQELLTLQEKLRSAVIPSELRGEIHQVLNDITEKVGNDFLFTIDFSIRGKSLTSKDRGIDFTQTITNVQPERLFDLYRERIVNLYEPSQVNFRNIKKIDGIAYLAAVCKIIPQGKILGKLCTLDPDFPHSNNMILTIFSSNSNERVSRKSYRISRYSPGKIISVSDQTADEGIEENSRKIISSGAITELVNLARRIERFFQRAQEIHWFQVREGKFAIIRIQTLKKSTSAKNERKPEVGDLSRFTVLYDNVGIVAWRGIGWGKVFLANNEEEIQNLPESAVLVIPHAFSGSKIQNQILGRAAAILVDSGKITDPLVFQARYLHIPCIIGLGDATKHLAPGSTITVDADENIIYGGQVDELIYYHLTEGLGYEEISDYEMFSMANDNIPSFTINEPSFPKPNLATCQSIYDLSSLAWENAALEFINQKELLSLSILLKFASGFTLRVIDIGEGLRPGIFSDTISELEDIQCQPLLVFSEIFTQYNKITSSLPPRPDNNIAIISREYLNLILNREGIFELVDCFLSEENEFNYIFGRFCEKIYQNNLNENLLLNKLEQFDFKVKKTSPALHFWIAGLSPQAIKERLRFIAQIMVLNPTVT